MLYRSSFYRTFFIPKKDGKKRQIDEPLPGLKNIQRWILDEILNKLSVSKYAKAYVKKRSVRSNAYYHRNRKCIIALDIKEYFASIHFSKVFSFFSSLGYTEHVACVLSNICLLNNALPQGAPTSPALSNLCTKDLDDDLYAFVKGKQIMYTRYADDIAFSGNFIDIREFYKNVKLILNKHGFRLNYAKTRVLHNHQRQLVTGIVVNVTATKSIVIIFFFIIYNHLSYSLADYSTDYFYQKHECLNLMFYES